MNLRSTSIIIVLALLSAFGLSAALHIRAASSSGKAVIGPLAVLSTTYVQQEAYERESSYLGLVQAGRKTVMGFELPGLLAEILVREGEPLQAGDIIAKLDTAKLKSARKATAADHKRVGIELELALIKANRQKNLSNTGAVSREAFDETRLFARALSAQLDAVQAQLESIDIDLQKSVLRAPYSGVVADRYLDEGAVVNPGTPVVKLVEIDRQEAHIGIAVEQAHLLLPGALHELSLRGSAQQVRLISVRPDVDPITRTVTAVFALPAGISALDGEPITLTLAQSVYMKGGWLPIASLLEGQRGIWGVLRIESTDGVLRTVREAVEVLEIQGDMAYVRGTIADGDRVVAHGIHRVMPGVTVTISEN